MTLALTSYECVITLKSAVLAGTRASQIPRKSNLQDLMRMLTINLDVEQSHKRVCVTVCQSICLSSHQLYAVVTLVLSMA